MQKLPSIKFSLAVAICCCNAFFPCLVKAEDASVEWGGQLYGGKYYKDNLIGAYGLVSAPFSGNLRISGEVLRERYRNHEYSYNISGVGAHIVWVTSSFTKFGLIGSHSRENYSFGTNIEGIKTNYLSNILGLEGEFGNDSLALAAQAGRVIDDDYSSRHRYFSVYFFYWGDLHLWNVRSGVRMVKNYQEYVLEGGYTFFADSFPTNLYVGTTRDNVFANDQSLSAPGQYNSVYTGCNLEFITTATSSWSLWVEASRQASETILSAELNISFGPSPVAPYNSALDYVR